MRRVAARVAALVMALAGADAAAVCEVTGRPAPDVYSFTTNLGDRAIYLQPDCSSSEPIPTVRGGSYDVKDSRLERVDRIPANTASVSITAPLSRGGDFTAGTVITKVTITSASTSAKNFAFPSSVYWLELLSSGVTDMELLAVPEGVKTLTIQGNAQFKSWKYVKLPSSIEKLDISDTQLAALNFPLPSKLQSIMLSGNPIATIDVALPDSLTSLTCLACRITSVRGIKLPSAMTGLSLGPTAITTFEIRQSDLDLLRSLNLGTTIQQPKCSDKTAKIVVLSQGNVCVISDARFNELYAGGPPSGDPDTPSTAGSPSTSSGAGADGTGNTPVSGNLNSSDASSGSSGSTKKSSRKSGSANGSGGGEETEFGGESGSGDEGSSSGNGGTTGTSSKKSVKGTTPGSGSNAGSKTTDKSSASFSTTTMVVLAIIGTVILTFAGACGYRVVAGKPDSDSDDTTTMPTGKYDTLSTPQTSTPQPTSESSKPRHELQNISNEYLDNDIRTDKAFSLYRIDSSAIKLRDAIATGRYGVIYRGTFGGQTVAIKQMLPDTCRNEAKVKNFMDEIRMCVRLEHPKIVKCIGISWTSLRDLSVVIEFMNGGDLHSVLQSQAGVEQFGREWWEKWTSRKLKSKTAIGADIAEAVVYLHSFNSPIIHRDLKSKNVLLDAETTAKLSDFGISREVPMDETMTREMGTIAWIAPEVLRGERYTEKADIYSLGVLLVELDRCGHPYSREDLLKVEDANSRGRGRTKGGTVSQAVMKNTRIAILVSTGKLCPRPSPSCPERIKELMGQCLSFDAADRPNAMVVFHGLRVFQKDANCQAS